MQICKLPAQLSDRFGGCLSGFFQAQTHTILYHTNPSLDSRVTQRINAEIFMHMSGGYIPSVSNSASSKPRLSNTVEKAPSQPQKVGYNP